MWDLYLRRFLNQKSARRVVNCPSFNEVSYFPPYLLTRVLLKWKKIYLTVIALLESIVLARTWCADQRLLYRKGHVAWTGRWGLCSIRIEPEYRISRSCGPHVDPHAQTNTPFWGQGRPDRAGQGRTGQNRAEQAVHTASLCSLPRKLHCLPIALLPFYSLGAARRGGRGQRPIGITVDILPGLSHFQ